MENDTRKKQLQEIKLEIDNLKKLKTRELIDSDSYFAKLLTCRKQLINIVKKINDGIEKNKGPISLYMFSKN